MDDFVRMCSVCKAIEFDGEYIPVGAPEYEEVCKDKKISHGIFSVDCRNRDLERQMIESTSETTRSICKNMLAKRPKKGRYDLEKCPSLNEQSYRK